MYLYRHQKLAKTCEVDPADIMQENDVSMTRVSAHTVRVGIGETKPLCAEINPLPDLTGFDLSVEEKERLQTLLHKHRAVFANHDEDYGQTSTVQHVIPTGEAPPVRERYRQIPPKMYQEVKALIQDASNRALGAVLSQVQDGKERKGQHQIQRKRGRGWRFPPLPMSAPRLPRQCASVQEGPSQTSVFNTTHLVYLCCLSGHQPSGRDFKGQILHWQEY
ncbi:uncharacterized protein LOC144464543 [Epinephelus lanceolatus]